MTQADISAVLVTRGDRDITPVTDSLKGFAETLVWDNTKLSDCKVLGRFLGAAMAREQTVYVQDDDCIVDTEALAALYRPGEILVNMPVERRGEYRGSGISLIGWGCIFPVRAVATLGPYTDVYGCDDLLKRECDRVFTYLNRDRIREVEVPFRQLDYAFGGDRMGRETRHGADFLEIRRRLATFEAARCSPQ